MRVAAAVLLLGANVRHGASAPARRQPWGAGLAARCEWAASAHGSRGSRCEHIPAAAPGAAAPRPGVPNCTERFFEQRVDHFSYKAHENVPATYQQRFFVHDSYWRRPSASGNAGASAAGAPPGPIFFYTGNEANVELYAVSYTHLTLPTIYSV